MTNTKTNRTRVVRVGAKSIANVMSSGKGTARSLATRAGVINEKPTIPDALSGGLVGFPAWQSPLKVTVPPFSGAVPGDIYVLKIDGNLLEDSLFEATDIPTQDVELFIPQADLDAISGAERGEDSGGHDLAYAVYTGIGSDDFHSLTTRLIIDRTPAGGERLPPIEFDRDITENGLSLEKLEALGGILEGVIASYEYQAADDTIHLYMLAPGSTTPIDAGTVNATTSGRTTVTFDEATLRKIPGGGVVNFFYTVIDRAGNDRFALGLSAQSPLTPIRILIEGAPDVDAFPPVLPDADDGLIVDAEARPFVRVQISPYATPEAGDIIVLHFGNRDFSLPALDESEMGNDPLREVEVSYDDVWQTPGKDIPAFSLSVSYDVIRLGFPHRSGNTDIDVDLSLPGGPDPDPGIGPVNENLPLPVLRGASGSGDNVITPPDAAVDASAIIPGLNQATLPADAFAEGDVIQLIWDGTPTGAPRTIAPGEEGLDLSIPVTPADLAAHPGTSDLWYAATRALPQGGPNVAESLAQSVTVLATGELPGGGTLAKGVWVEGKTAFPPGRPDAINYSKATTPPGSGTPVRIYGYANMDAGDTVTFSFKGYQGALDDPGSPIPASDYQGSYRVKAGDTEPKSDNLAGGAQAIFFDIDIPEPNLLKIIAGWGSFDFTITNGVGDGVGEMSSIIIDCVPPN